MPDIAIKIEHISKIYQLGIINNGTLWADMQTFFARKFGREDPHSKIGEDKYSDDKDHFWALKDVSLDIKQGDRVGIIGKNGAGKSTLLKILSRITTPTEGAVKIRGKIASLLEVGTGFHGELTGRENIYLNGAILGMKKRRISEKLDEIIAFSGIEKHIDTPVKRYSSGMYVRLAFAVAAHLDSDILIADEVLAVGDAEFQEKALGKMQEVSTGEGRTVLFVSHNMGAVKRLCNKGFYLHGGKLISHGAMYKIIDDYYRSISLSRREGNESLLKSLGDKKFIFTFCCIKNRDGAETDWLNPGEPITVEIHYTAQKKLEKPCIGVQVDSSSGGLFAASMVYDALSPDYIEGTGTITCRFTDILLLPGSYSITLRAQLDAGLTILADTMERACSFSIIGDKIDYGMNGVNASKFMQSSAPLLCTYEWIYNSGIKVKQTWGAKGNGVFQEGV